MFVLTWTQGIVLAAAGLGLLVALLLGVLRLLPRSPRVVSVYVTCPVLGRRVAARATRDEWTRGFGAIVSCDVLGAGVPVTCNQRCLTMSVVPLAGV